MAGIYVHVPFCMKRCNYCDFITYQGMTELIPDYLASLEREIQESLTQFPDLDVSTVYIGGGTPSMLEGKAISGLMHVLQNCFSLDRCTEITIEVNPGTVTKNKLEKIINSGINRLSLGVQSLDDESLVKLGRIHTRKQAITTIERAVKIGFTNISIDLLFGLPWQSVEQWKATLIDALALHTQHISIYNLTLEAGTPLAEAVAHRQYPQPDDDLSADMYELTQQLLSSSGYRQYEISNWSFGGKFESEHNKNYWRNNDYLGFGVGAHSYYIGVRHENTPSIPQYIEMINNSTRSNPWPLACINSIEMSKFEQMQDTMMLGLRMTGEGVSCDKFYRKYACDMAEVFGNEIDQLIKAGICEWGEFEGDKCFRLTKRGVLVGNRAFRMFVG